MIMHNDKISTQWSQKFSKLDFISYTRQQTQWYDDAKVMFYLQCDMKREL